MTDNKHMFTSESVFEGHPDKVCDQISDAILDAMLAQDPESRSGCECFAKTGMVLIGGEISTKAYVDIPKIARGVLKRIGYTKAEDGIEWETCAILTHIEEQSPDIAQGVDEGKGEYKEQGAGDQGMMFGYATNETPELMPLSLMLSHKIAKQASQVRKNGTLKYLRPDGKCQVTIEYDGDKPVRAHTVVVSLQHDPNITHAKIKKDVLKHVIKPVCGKWLDKNTIIYVNPTGKFVRGGPYADAGLTGRKIIVDTYGGHGAHGGGCFSGKDPSKVDRSGAYMARYIAKNIVAAKLASKCEIELAYAIGVAEPVSIHVNTFRTNKVSEKRITELVRTHFKLKPAQIVQHLNLKRPIYEKTACYGHFGRTDPDFTWEKIDKVTELKKATTNKCWKCKTIYEHPLDATYCCEHK